MDWGITFSKYDFPWRDVAFGSYSAKECYKMYTETIQDVQSFYKRVLCEKQNLKKLIANQLDEPQRLFYSQIIKNRQVESD